MKFEWSDEKNRTNFKKHRIWFEEAQSIWADPLAVEFFDPDHSKDEDRFIRLGHTSGSNLIFVVFCELESGNRIRIISSRKATQKERKQYEEGI